MAGVGGGGAGRCGAEEEGEEEEGRWWGEGGRSGGGEGGKEVRRGRGGAGAYVAGGSERAGEAGSPRMLQTPARPSRRWDKAGPQIFYVDSDGQRLDGRLFSVGSGSTFAYGVLDTGYSYDLSTAEALELAERSIFAATYRDAYSGGTVRIYHIDADGWKRIRETDSMELYFKFKAEATAA